MDEKRRKDKIKCSPNKSNTVVLALFLKSKRKRSYLSERFSLHSFSSRCSFLSVSLSSCMRMWCGSTNGGGSGGGGIRKKKREWVSKQKNRKQRRRNMKPPMTLKQSIPPLFPAIFPFQSPDPS